MPEEIKKIKRNWRTSALGIVALVGALVLAATALLDGDPATNINIDAILAALVGAGFLAASDGK